MNLKCIVIDDEPLAREGIADYVRQVNTLQLCGVFSDAIEATNFLASEKVDLIFLDIEMPKLNGIAFIQSLRNPPLIIFTTAYPHHALKGFELDVLDYLVKPISFERFLKATNKALERKLIVSQSKELEKDNYIFIKSDNKFHKIQHSDIIYIEGLKDYVKIHTEEGARLVLVNLKNIESKLPANIFIRVHKSFIVSVGKITSIEGNLIHIGATTIPIGKEYKNALFEKLINKKLIKR
jgi:two-component system, LytTR family, response regulator